MNPLNIIKSFLGGPARMDNAAVNSAPVTSPGHNDDRIINALDAAVDALGESSLPTGKTDRPLGSASLPDKKKGPRQEEIKADKIRAEIRADIERMNRQNQIDREKEAKDKAEAAEKAQEAALRTASSWEVQFKNYRPAEPVNMTEDLIGLVIRRGGLKDIITKRAEKVQQELDDWDIAFEARGQFSHEEFKRQLHEDMKDNENRLRDGDKDLRNLADQEAFARQASLNRDICKAAQRKAAEAVNPTLLEIAEDIQMAARKLAVERAIKERNEAFDYGVAFEPSCILISLASVGYDLRQFVEHNWLCGPLVCPRTTLYGILDLNKDWK